MEPIQTSLTELQYMHKVKYCLAIKRNELLMHAISRMDFRIITVTERKFFFFPVYTVGFHLYNILKIVNWSTDRRQISDRVQMGGRNYKDARNFGGWIDKFITLVMVVVSQCFTMGVCVCLPQNISNCTLFIQTLR